MSETQTLQDSKWETIWNLMLLGFILFMYILRFILRLTSEWQTNIHRDSYASYIGHPPLLQYFALALGEPQAKVRTDFIDVSSCGVAIYPL